MMILWDNGNEEYDKTEAKMIIILLVFSEDDDIAGIQHYTKSLPRAA